MAERVSSMAEIPLSEVLERKYLAAEGDLRGLGIGLDGHRPVGASSEWHWYPQLAADPQPSTDRIHNVLLDTGSPRGHPARTRGDRAPTG